MKNRVVYICSSCGARSPKWQGKCNSCGAWSSFVEEKAEPEHKKIMPVRDSENKIYKLSEISTDENFRIFTKISELDRVLGGGIIPGSLVLIGGDPGIGKSTLMLQALSNLIEYNAIYITGEESLQQIRYRSERLTENAQDLLIASETSIEQISFIISGGKYRIAVVDSIQSVYSEKIDAAPGSIVQVRECAALLLNIAKKSGCSIFIIGHITKEGIIAGPKILEHIVDTVLQFEGEKTYSYRILRAVKNRFGSTNEIGIFEMGGSGLREVNNPSELFLAERHQEDSGTAIVAAIEGSRPILLEVQALVTPTSYGVPQRTATGCDSRRLQMILAVLEKRLGILFRQQDVFVNIAGGVYLSDPSIDLAIASALVSSHRDIPLDPRTVIIGEIGLTGEVRSVSAVLQRINEAEKLGFSSIVLPKSNIDKLGKEFIIELIPVERISLALNKIM
ncbi:MAG: hypothetical protein QG635_565 [Bacteroidota bacterium]|nr:hypothetical protein [Bacteroidota bacterium]